MTTPSIPGIHHITAIAGDPQRNLDFYTTVLGLRLVKLQLAVREQSEVAPLAHQHRMVV